MSDMTITSGRAWRERVQGGVVLPLPSGFVARIRGVQPDVLLRTGTIPDALTSVIAAIMEGTSDAQEAFKSLDDLRNYADLVNAICASVMLEPRIVENPQADDEIGIDDLEWPDRVFLMGAVGTTTRQLERFRDQQTLAMDALDAAKRHGDTREPVGEPESVGA